MSHDVQLRPYEPDDAASLMAAAQESFEQIWPWMPWCHPNYGLDDARAWIDTTQWGRRHGEQFDFAIIARGRFAGACGINKIDSMDQVANLGYWIRTSCTGQGLAAAAVVQLLDWAFEHTHLNRIEIVAAVDNHRSQRVAEKVGAHRDAVLAQRTMVRGEPSAAVLYSVTRPDWTGAGRPG